VTFAAKKGVAMSSSGKPFTTVTLEDGMFAVVRTDPRKPRLLEVIAIFSDTSRARDYADRESSWAAEPAVAPKGATTWTAGGPPATTPELSARQSAVLAALRAKMDANKQVEAKAAVLAEAANVPLGSLHSILQSLEKKGLIKNTRAGSARAPAVYQVLQRTARPIDEAEQAA
jgi:hypothetical protein